MPILKVRTWRQREVKILVQMAHAERGQSWKSKLSALAQTGGQGDESTEFLLLVCIQLLFLFEKCSNVYFNHLCPNGKVCIFYINF